MPPPTPNSRSRSTQVTAELLGKEVVDEDGEIIVKLFTSHNGKETDLEVSNTCKEPPQGDLTKLFDRFYRDDSSRSRSKGEKKGGYGIGLSIAQAIVRSHKSKISCKVENGMMIFTAQLK